MASLLVSFLSGSSVLQGKTKEHMVVDIKKSYTLVEMLVVISVIGLILAMTVAPVHSMWIQRHCAATVTQIEGMLQVARQKAMQEKTRYGICFLVDQQDRQHATFIKWGGAPPEQCLSGPLSGSYWNRYADRFVPVKEGYYSFPTNWRARPLIPPLRNVFVIVFNPDGKKDILPKNFRYIVCDKDPLESSELPADGIGDITEMPLNNIVGQWHLYSDPLDDASIIKTYNLDEPIRNAVDLNSEDNIPYTEFENSWGIMIYDHAEWASLLVPNDISFAENYIKREGIPILLEREGRIISVKGQK